MTGAGNNTYLLAAGGSATLIDAGVGEPRHLDELAAALSAAGARLDRVLVTHGHHDHAGGAPAIASRHPSAVFTKRPWPGVDEATVRWEQMEEGERVVAGGEPLVALHTPGHSPDHLSFWHEPSRTLFSGDLVVLGGSVMIHTSRGGNLSQYLATLERLIALDANALLPAHGPRIDDPAAVLRAYLEHRRMRERQVIEALRAGREHEQAIAESIYDGLDPALMPAARENVRAHLEKLEADGAATRDADRWRLAHG